MLQQVNGHSSGSGAQGRASLKGDLREFLGGEVPLHQLDDLTKVNPVTLETVLRCLQARYAEDIFYTNAGCTLVALNPFKPIPQLYTPELMREYHAAPQPQKLKPHIFTVGEQTYRNVKSLIEPINQSIVVSGESGAGKTWTSRCLMKFYAVVAASPTSCENHKIAERIEQRILNSNPVMEAFGNACTLRNNNSSRFGKFIQLQLNRAQQMTGAAVQTYLLEKTRVACQASSERNFHIFYQICKGATEDERLQWHLPEGATFSWLPNPESNLEEDCFEVTREAMLHLGIDTSTQNNIFKVLAGLLHLGNVHFAYSEDEAQPCQLMDDTKVSVRTSASLLQLPEDMLLETMQIRTIKAGKQQQVFRKPCSQAECETRRDCLAKVIYARLFDWLVSVINSSICADPRSWTAFIGLLDVYGFESFPDNSLEQLCINYANEKLQQHFVAHYLRAQQEEYAVEGLEWSFVNYQDNQTCLDLLEGSPISICSLINEECRLNRPSSAAQLQTRIENALAGRPCLGQNKLSREPSFVVVHFAGPVRYHTAGLVEKNKDPVPPELTGLLQQSQDPLLMMLFPANPKEKTQEELSGQSRAPALTVVSKFKVLSQLEACGLVETIHISAAGFPIRVSHQNFMERYKLLRRLRLHTSSGFWGLCPAKGPSEQPLCAKEATLQPLLQDILHALPALIQTAPTPSDPAKATQIPLYCGRTKIFMTDSMLELLECGRAQMLEQCARCIQCGWRRYLQQKQEKQRQAAVLIQAAVRSWLTRTHIRRLHTAATVIKRAWHAWRIRMACLASKELDGMEENLMTQAPGSLSSSLPRAHSKLLGAIIHLWPLGLVLANSAVGTRGFQRKLVAHACLRLPPVSASKVQTAQQAQAGITSIRALPQGSVKFHCRKSPLQYADICPEPSASSVAGFNQILLERHRPVQV
ncbi:unconventional myosin-XIX isoform X2 [Psammomys obesus]|uniref:unconventional myosin-XIX isoform X2 n=1 Tax=Psammomys obesus TaxID=48139 RepID=UPI0024535EE9|nr:unconventional myosin-XIX isoform X2 [Psammomys obesus]